jgi:hypothetical protein
LKTDKNQTEFLLLNKGRATLDPGLLWKFNVFLQGYHVIDNLSVKCSYEYIKHDEDRLSEKDYGFNHDVINTANSLKEWNVHNIILQANYDFFNAKDHLPVSPQLSVFYKIPVGGKGVIAASSVGGQVFINF